MSIKKISSAANPTIKEIRKLLTKKGRAKTQRYIIEGIRVVADALQHGAPVDTLIYCPELLTSEFAIGLVDEFAATVNEVLEVTPDVFSSLAQKEHPQGIAAVAGMKYQALSEIKVGGEDIWVVLDTVRDPGNLGTIIRTVDGVGGSGVILLDDCVDAYDPTAIRASMGGIFTQQIVHCGFDEFSEWKALQGVKIIGTSDHEGRLHYREAAYQYPVFLMMGSEREGLPAPHLDLCDEIVAIPMFGTCDSLNLSVATGIVLYEVVNQLKGKGI